MPIAFTACSTLGQLGPEETIEPEFQNRGITQWLGPVGKTLIRPFENAGMPITSRKNMEFGDKQDTVKLITYHSSKGLEFPRVVIPGVSISTDEDKAAEDEERLLYVAMTRATRGLLVLEGAVGWSGTRGSRAMWDWRTTGLLTLWWRGNNGRSAKIWLSRARN